MMPALETMASILPKAFTVSVDQASHVRLLRDITHNGKAADRRRRFLCPRRVHIPANASPPLRRKLRGAGPADPMTRARDDRDLGVIRLHANFPFCAIML